MEPRLIALKLLLDALGIPATIDTIDDRKRVQKAIYLGQLADIDLGYRFGWYLRGPYSPALTRDYYSMAQALELKDTGLENTKLADSVVQRIKEKIEPLFSIPSGVTLPLEDWLELIASIHFLRNISQYSKEKTLEILKEKKDHVANFADKAEAALKKVGLLS